MTYISFVYFFFFKQKTAYEMRISDWSSDVCSSDLLGAHTGQRVLNGLIKRGDGEDIPAVIWYCDLRGSTALADTLPRADYLALLNRYFAAVAGAVLERGGEARQSTRLNSSH